MNKEAKSTEVSGKADTVIDTDGRSSPSDFDGLIIPSLLDVLLLFMSLLYLLPLLFKYLSVIL